MELLDSDNFTAGVGMTQQGRANLMAKLAQGHNAGERELVKSVYCV